MLYEKLSQKSLPEIELALRDSAARHHFGVILVHDLQKIMRSKGVDFPRQCSVFEVCNPEQARRVLDAHGAMASLLPCRIAAYETADGLMLSTVLPGEMIRQFNAPDLEPVASEVEAVLQAMIDAAA